MRRFTIVAAAALTLSGCASFSPDGGFDEVSALTRERVGQPAALQRTPGQSETARERVTELQTQPLTAEDAVELALLNNRALQARFGELGIAEADLVRAGRLRNPLFGFGRLEGGGVVEIDRTLMFDILGLLTMPAAVRVERQRFEQAQVQAAHEAVGLAAQARRAWFGAVAARELLRYQEQVREAADAANELARRMVEAGNFSPLAQMREQTFYADATARLARARHHAVAERERLARLLGLSDERAFSLPERLPSLPDAPTEPRDAEQTALDRRLDVLMARRATEATARSLGLTRATRWVNVLELGYQNKSETGASRQNGYELELELPLFDFGSARTARAEALYLQALNRAAAVAVQARSEVRESYSAYRTAYDLARHYRDEVVPLRKRISEENLLRYNGMLIGVFELLADAREQVASVSGSVEALRDFWVAETDLQHALAGGSPVAAAAFPWPIAAEPVAARVDHP